MKNNSFNLSGKTIVVTGASSGIGKQCAISFSNVGAKIILLGRNTERLKDTLKKMDKTFNHSYYSIDLTDYEKTLDLIEIINKDNGQINGLLNAAGISSTIPLKMIKPELIKEYYETNVISAINLSRLFSQKKYFSSNGGSIILMSSVMGIVGEIGKTLYSLTKGALISAAKSMALELAPRKIRVNSISPGVVETPMSQNAFYSRNEETLNNIKKLHPLGLGEPEDIANACIFLLSDASRWITGTNLIIDGGYTAR